MIVRLDNIFDLPFSYTLFSGTTCTTGITCTATVVPLLLVLLLLLLITTATTTTTTTIQPGECALKWKVGLKQGYIYI